MKEILLHLVKYNYWANKIIVQTIIDKAFEQLDVQIPNSFPSLRKTLLHIWDAETIWYKRLHNISVADLPSKDFGTQESVFDSLIKQSELFVYFVSSKTENNFTTNCEYVNLKGEKFSQPIYTILMHCMNHSTFHRGQIICMLRQLGYDNLPSTDLISFSRNC